MMKYLQALISDETRKTQPFAFVQTTSIWETSI